MPCSDVTELVRVVLDAEDRLKDYSFVKRTCGQSVGAASFIIDQLRGKTTEQLLAFGADDILAEVEPAEEIEEFLCLKHFFAVQVTLEVLTGAQSGAANDACAAAEISFADDELIIEARLRVDLLTEKIKSCGNCGSCGKKKKAPVFL